MGIYEELQARGLIAQVTDEERIRDLVNAGKATFYLSLIHIQMCIRDRIETFKNIVEEFTGNKVTADKLAESIKLINNKRKALERLYDLRKNETLPISGCDALLISQIAFYDDPARFTQMTNKLCDELEKRVADGVSVVPAGTKRIMLTGTPLACLLYTSFNTRSINYLKQMS